MRINEIVVDKKKEANLAVIKYFNLSRSAEFSIDDEGYISANGTITLKTPGKKLPLKFKHMIGNFICSDAGLETLEGCPELVLGNFRCNGNNLKSLVGGPKLVQNDYNCFKNLLESLEGLPEEIGGTIFIDYYETLPLIKLLLIKNLKRIVLVPATDPTVKKITAILNKHIGTGRKGALLAVAELSRAGFARNAKL